MNLKRHWLWLACIAVLLVLGGYFLLARWENDKRVGAILSLDEQQILANGEPLVLYSLQPPFEVAPQELKTKPVFHGYRILGQTQVTSAATRKDLLGALYTVIGKEQPAMCFNPRHGIRAVRGKQTIDLVICFECQQIHIYDEQGRRETTVGGSPKLVFNGVLTQAHVPLSRP